jgi:hypothetical protein
MGAKIRVESRSMEIQNQRAEEVVKGGFLRKAGSSVGLESYNPLGTGSRTTNSLLTFIVTRTIGVGYEANFRSSPSRRIWSP